MDTATTEYERLPLNGLATTADIIEEQMRSYGVVLNDQNTFDELTDDGTTTRDAYWETTSPPDATTSAPTATPSPPAADAYVYDGPADTGTPFGTILASYGIPTSAASLITKAEEALIGIPDDIRKGDESIVQILTKDSRLQGIGAALIIVAVIIGMIQVIL